MRVEGESMIGEVRVEGRSTSGEVQVKGEQSTSSDGKEQDSTVKRPRLEISAPWLPYHYRSGLITFLEMTCSMLHYCCTQASQGSLDCRRRTQRLLLPNF